MNLTYEAVQLHRKRLGITWTEIAEACGLDTSSVHYYQGKEFPERYSKLIMTLLVTVAKEKGLEPPEDAGPITLGETARVKKISIEEEEFEEDADNFTMPSLQDLQEMYDQGHISYDYANLVRAHVKVPRLFMDTACGFSDGWWSRAGKTDRTLPRDKQKRVIEVLISLIHLRKGDSLEPVEEIKAPNTVVKDIAEILEAVEQNCYMIDNRISRRITIDYIKAVQQELNKL